VGREGDGRRAEKLHGGEGAFRKKCLDIPLGRGKKKRGAKGRCETGDPKEAFSILIVVDFDMRESGQGKSLAGMKRKKTHGRRWRGGGGEKEKTKRGGGFGEAGTPEHVKRGGPVDRGGPKRKMEGGGGATN